MLENFKGQYVMIRTRSAGVFCEILEVILPEAIEIIPVTDEAKKSIKNVEIWSA